MLALAYAGLHAPLTPGNTLSSSSSWARVSTVWQDCFRAGLLGEFSWLPPTVRNSEPLTTLTYTCCCKNSNWLIEGPMGGGGGGDCCLSTERAWLLWGRGYYYGTRGEYFMQSPLATKYDYALSVWIHLQ